MVLFFSLNSINKLGEQNLFPCFSDNISHIFMASFAPIKSSQPSGPPAQGMHPHPKIAPTSPSLISVLRLYCFPKPLVFVYGQSIFALQNLAVFLKASNDSNPFQILCFTIIIRVEPSIDFRPNLPASNITLSTEYVASLSYLFP